MSPNEFLGERAEQIVVRVLKKELFFSKDLQKLKNE